MIASLSLILAQQSTTFAAKLPAELRAMQEHYAKTVWAQGHIRLTVTASGETTHVDTDFAYEKPSKLYIRQVKQTGDPRIITSDGSFLTYDDPNYPRLTRFPRLKEAIDTKKRLMMVPDLYKASVLALYDRSVPLDIVMGHPADFEFFASQLASIKKRPEVAYAGQPAVLFEGVYRPYGQAAPIGSYGIALSPKSDLLAFWTEESIKGDNDHVYKVQFLWELSADLDGKIDRSLFTLVP